MFQLHLAPHQAPHQVGLSSGALSMGAISQDWLGLITVLYDSVSVLALPSASHPFIDFNSCYKSANPAWQDRTLACVG